MQTFLTLAREHLHADIADTTVAEATRLATIDRNASHGIDADTDTVVANLTADAEVTRPSGTRAKTPLPFDSILILSEQWQMLDADTAGGLIGISGISEQMRKIVEDAYQLPKLDEMFSTAAGMHQIAERQAAMFADLDIAGKAVREILDQVAQNTKDIAGLAGKPVTDPPRKRSPQRKDDSEDGSAR